jgi:cellulose synthase/poly-beta-1,6-N-acetylglucosamine synthase-like glycosyltransferase
MDLVSPVLLVGSLALTAHALFSLYLLLYSWEYPERLEASQGPSTEREPALGFTVLLPARHEEKVIGGTIRRIWAARYPRKLLQILVICHDEDVGTIKEVRRTIRQIGSRRVRLVTFSGNPINKPRALNVGLAQARHEVITVFDAEDDVDPDVFSIVNTVMLDEKTGVVQSGVQLMNFTDHWFSIHNCLEYFFWFKSRLHFHAKVGMIPLGGNTIFMRRDLVDRVGGWDATCLTEDADIGLRLSLLGEPIRVIYNAQHVTREETPSSVESLVRQRTRWNQGFMHVLRKGAWLELPTRQQRALALYTFSYPFIQAPTTLLWPLAVVAGLFLKVPVPIAMASFLPLYALLFQLLLMMVGAFMFAREYGLRVPWSLPFKMMVTFMPYQLILGFSAARAAYRELHGEGSWEKTEHPGAHRRAPVPAPVVSVLKPVRWGLERLGPSLGATRGWGASRARLLVQGQRDALQSGRSALRILVAAARIQLVGAGAWMRSSIRAMAADVAGGLANLLIWLSASGRRVAGRVAAWIMTGGASGARSSPALRAEAGARALATAQPVHVPSAFAASIRASLHAPTYAEEAAAHVAPERIGTPMESACPACGRMMSINARFCRRCGAPSVAPKPLPVPSRGPAISWPRRRVIAFSIGTVLALMASFGFLEIMLAASQPTSQHDRQPTRDNANPPALVRVLPTGESVILDIAP